MGVSQGRGPRICQEACGILIEILFEEVTTLQ